MKIKRGIVYFIGAGPGNPELLTVKAKKIIERATLLVYAGSLVNPEILSIAKNARMVIDSAPLTLDAIIAKMAAAALNSEIIARLHSGDPSLYGAIGEQMDALSKQGIAFEIVPGVSSVFAAAAALQREFTVPGITQSLILTRRAGRTPVPKRESLMSLSRHKASMAVFLSTGMIEQTVSELITGGYSKNTPAAVVYRASWQDERVVEATLSTLADRVKEIGINRQAIILVGDAMGKSQRKKSALYSPDFTHGYRSAKKKRHDTLAVVALSKAGAAIGKKITETFANARLFLPLRLRENNKYKKAEYYKNLESLIALLFKKYKGLIFIMAAGIAVRIIAPFLRSKWDDPAVVVMDDKAKNVISLLSGHWGGANELAQKLANTFHAHCVITTSSDLRDLPPLDLLVQRLGAGEFLKEALSKVQAKMVAGESIALFPPELSLISDMQKAENLHFYNSPQEALSSGCAAGLIFSHEGLKFRKIPEHYLFVHPRDLVVGIGCRKATDEKEIASGIEKVFQKHHLPTEAIVMICTIDAKKKEDGLLRFAKTARLSVKFFSATKLNSVSIPSPRSKPAMQYLQVQGVAEPSALAGANGGSLIIEKEKLPKMTLAVAQLPFATLIREKSRKNTINGDNRL